MTVSAVFERTGWLFTRDVIKRAGEIPHTHNDAFRTLWRGGTVDADALGLYTVNKTVYYTECGTVGTTVRSPSDSIGMLVGKDSERVVASVQVE